MEYRFLQNISLRKIFKNFLTVRFAFLMEQPLDSFINLKSTFLFVLWPFLYPLSFCFTPKDVVLKSFLIFDSSIGITVKSLLSPRMGTFYSKLISKPFPLHYPCGCGGYIAFDF